MIELAYVLSLLNTQKIDKASSFSSLDCFSLFALEGVVRESVFSSEGGSVRAEERVDSWPTGPLADN